MNELFYYYFISINQLNTRIDLGPLQVAGLNVVYENSLVKTYASYRSFVPENILFLLGIEFLQSPKGKLISLFGDQIGQFVFLGAVSHTTDRSGLPTGILCMSVEAFNAWFPINPEQIQVPQRENFCLCRTDEFLADSNTAEQKILLSNDKFKIALKQFIQFMVELKLALGKSSFDETFLGYKELIAAAVTTPANNSLASTTSANNNAKSDLTEDEKLALMTGADGIRKSSRVAGHVRSSYGPSFRIPIGALALPEIPSNKMKKQPPKDDGTKKKSSLNNGKTIDPPNHQIYNKIGKQLPPKNPPTATPRSKLTKAQLLEELNSQKIANTTSALLHSAPSSQLTHTPFDQNKLRKVDIVAEPAPAKDDITSRIDYRSQGKLDFEQAESYARSFYSFGKTMLTDFKGFHSKHDEQ